VLRFTHYQAERAEYRCTLQGGTASGFEVLATVVAPPAGPDGCDVEVEVHFEPSIVGEALRDTLVVSSPSAGEYVCPLLGRCQPPKPLGPIMLAKNAGTVAFKNVFSSEAEFLYAVDNPAFSVKPGEKIGAKKSVSIAVTYKGPVAGGSAGPVAAAAEQQQAQAQAQRSTGKLTVSCPKLTSAQWVFYLQA
jgi:hydrocephalus-inducing protein